MLAKPGRRRESVTRDDSPGADPVLIVAVRARAVDGAANEAIRAAVAAALGLRPRQVILVKGERSRTKLLELDGGDADLRRALAELPGAG